MIVIPIARGMRYLTCLASVFASVTLLPVSAVSAQSAPSREALAWLAYFGRVDLSSRWYATGEFHERRWLDPFRVHQRLARTHLQRRVGGGLSLGVGYTYFQQGVQDPERPALPLVNEHRPHVQADLSHEVTPRITACAANGVRCLLRLEGVPSTVNTRMQDGLGIVSVWIPD